MGAAAHGPDKSVALTLSPETQNVIPSASWDRSDPQDK